MANPTTTTTDIDSDVRRIHASDLRRILKDLITVARNHETRIDSAEDDVAGLPLTSTTLATATELTIANGSITPTTNYHTVDTEADAASDNLDTIVSTGNAGQLLFLRPSNDGRTVVLRSGQDNIRCPSGQNLTLAEDEDIVCLLLNDALTAWDVVFYKTLADGAGGLGAALASVLTGKGASLIGIEDAAAIITAANVEAALLEFVIRLGTVTIADPGTGVAIPVTRSGHVELVIANAAETNTLAIPTWAGQRLLISVTSLAGTGTRAITVASAIDDGGTTVITFRSTKDLVELEAFSVAGALAWRRIGTPNSSAQLDIIPDPGTGTAIPVTRSGSVAITQNGAETNTLAIPTFRGQELELFVDTDTSGARVITSAQRINQAGNTIITMTEVGDYIRLRAITIGGALRWQVVSNDGCALS